MSMIELKKSPRKQIHSRRLARYNVYSIFIFRLNLLSDYYSVFRLILNGYLERILIYDLTRNLIAFGNIELYSILLL
jgi:hypothetical protein